MRAIVDLYSEKDNEINNFLNKFYDNLDLKASTIYCLYGYKLC